MNKLKKIAIAIWKYIDATMHILLIVTLLIIWYQVFISTLV